MRHDEIQPGMTLRLKPARQRAYGLNSGLVTVDALKPRPGYKVPFVRSGENYFMPQDFQGEKR